MKLIIAGSRHLEASPKEIEALLNHYNLKPKEIVSGTAKGIDTSGELFALLYQISVKRFPADWDKFGKSAGYRRNKQMAEYADALLLIWDGSSRGSMHMRTLMMDIGKPVFEAIT